ncbi:hypothetical protein CDD80_350 [Ophiocordyceps camponoti-rufipedis]|uniref:Peptidase S8/S53 domain-containing protein n=1 Tax=Ophiocordyceps camponoti-rufipedis TaxID=2004952 RepID=A0A2C5ZLK3_9HYPO|nr:hypothetical protein CDD80_350 [Ophiocordyceps camponoti-rufipedis]
MDADAVIRKTLYKHVVSKLEAALDELTWAPTCIAKRKRAKSQASDAQTETRVKRICQAYGPDTTQYHVTAPLRFKGGPVPLPEQLAVPHQSAISRSGMFDGNQPQDFMHSPDLCHGSDTWIETHKRIYEEVISPLDEAICKRVKVAILDTGLDMSHPDFQACSDRIIEVRSWLDGLRGEMVATPQDDCGHGTHVTSLLLGIAPDCDVYIARIAKTKPLAPAIIAEVITYAVRKWEVDIVSMSFGYTDETEPGSHQLRAALSAAQSSQVLLFAAASNSGGRTINPAFPASVSKVFCIYGGDGNGNSSRTTPTARRDESNFLILGEAVEAAWPCQLSKNPWRRRMSGTSFATPIAAGVAAFLLMYVLKEPETSRDTEPDMANIKKTYFLCPNWDYHPDGPLKLGNIIISPHRPGQALNGQEAPQAADVCPPTTKTNVTWSLDKFRSGQYGLWTEFLSFAAGLGVGIRHDDEVNQTFTFESIETIEFSPSVEFLQKTLASSPAAAGYLDRCRLRKHIYIITAVKIAHGASGRTVASNSFRAGLQASTGGNATQTNFGPRVNGQTSLGGTDAFSGSSPFVFAFRLRKIVVSRSGKVSQDEYTKGAMYGNERAKLREMDLVVEGVGERDASAAEFQDVEGSVTVKDDGEIVDSVRAGSF